MDKSCCFTGYRPEKFSFELKLGSPENMVAFCGGIQSGSPVDSYVSPEPSPIPGYLDEVIMAAGTFTQGASIELSAEYGLYRQNYCGCKFSVR